MNDSIHKIIADMRDLAVHDAIPNLDALAFRLEALCKEPVAWRYQLQGDIFWNYDDSPDLANGYIEGGVIQPLFAAPQPAAKQWQPIETAPKDRSIALVVKGTPSVPMYYGRYRAGYMGEPQQREIAWRCDSSGTFAHPTHWMEKPEPPR